MNTTANNETTTAKKATHTPGPWVASFNGNDDTRIFAESVGDSPRAIAKVNTPLNRGLESVANARLIAAAPTMLSALESAVAQFDFTVAAMAKGQTVSISSLQNCAAAARAAIARATQP